MEETRYFHLYTCIDHPDQTFRLKDSLVGLVRPRCAICNKRLADSGEMVKRGLDAIGIDLDIEHESKTVKKAKAYAAKRKRELEK